MASPHPNAPRSRLPSSKDDESRKSAEALAERIEDAIAKRGWRVGTVLGSEETLLRRYRVSRAVLREAIRILEHHRTAMMRRGPGGGLVVNRPDPSAVARAAGLVLDFEKATPNQLSDARIVVELAAVEEATRRIDEEAIEKLRDGIREEARRLSEGTLEVALHDLHILIAELSGNPVYPLFVRVLTRVMEAHYVPRRPKRGELERMVSRVHRSHEKIVEAMVGGDVALARHRMQRDLEALVPYLC